ncbi:diacylglycerol O-acyltransferase 1 [Scheffersomyces spartinae]|uniref:diacylglycerol O-acyltransferase n=1 Tax=Scheffersomyces spartinae TaxID=45513 RepID=A0A9P8AHW8_9ASCO|nr:diacylglycerol O-acyltransferase 1 [Scheffersomyces spartinae]KAG7193124.1 diacylglycerol O-acyltransferase 1 [Scheffersomyces spartinae]
MVEKNVDSDSTHVEFTASKSSDSAGSGLESTAPAEEFPSIVVNKNSTNGTDVTTRITTKEEEDIHSSGSVKLSNSAATDGSSKPLKKAPPEATQEVSVKAKTKQQKKDLHLCLNIAPLNTPLQNRLETFAVMWHCVSIPSFIILFLILLWLGWVVWLGVIIPYYIWWYGFDLHTPTNGKVVYRTRDWMRNLIIWKWFIDYFPIRVMKTVDLEPTFSNVLVQDDDLPDDEEDLVSEFLTTIIDRLFMKLGLHKRLNLLDRRRSSVSLSSSSNKIYKRVTTGPRYIFCYHPHGVISMGVMGMFATNAVRNEPFQPPARFLKPLFHDPSKYKRLFPGIGQVFPLTLTTQFTLPFYRDYLLSLGLTSASANNIKSLINNGDNSVCLVVGGAKESLLNNMVAPKYRIGKGYKGGIDSSTESKDNKKKSEIKLVLQKRKGFVKLAIELGNVALVPVFAFGEADIYKLNTPKPGSFGYWLQQWIKDKFLFTIPFFSARGVFIYDFGLLPYRNPINVVMGRPIYVPEGILSDYKRNHPEFFKEDVVTTLGNNKTELSGFTRKSSFSNLLSRATSSIQKSDSTGSSKSALKGNETPTTTYSRGNKNLKTKIPIELVDHYHHLYVEELKRVYEENKFKYGYGDVELNIID